MPSSPMSLYLRIKLPLLLRCIGLLNIISTKLDLVFGEYGSNKDRLVKRPGFELFIGFCTLGRHEENLKNIKRCSHHEDLTMVYLYWLAKAYMRAE